MDRHSPEPRREIPGDVLRRFVVAEAGIAAVLTPNCAIGVGVLNNQHYGKI